MNAQHTPRTDAQRHEPSPRGEWCTMEPSEKGEWVPVELAQGMEIQNATLAAERDRLKAALVKCDLAFVNWQIGQIPGRPEDILALITEVRAALTGTGPSPQDALKAERDELLATLKVADETLLHAMQAFGCDPCGLIEARAAIRKAQGGQTKSPHILQLEEILKHDGVAANVGHLLSLKGRVFNTEVSSILDQLSPGPRVQFQAALDRWLAAQGGAGA